MNKNMPAVEAYEMSYTTVINRIYYLMNKRGWSIKTLSERSNIPYDTLKKLLSKKITNTSMHNILKIASAFHCRVDFLLGLDSYARANDSLSDNLSDSFPDNLSGKSPDTLSFHSRSVVHYLKEMEDSLFHCSSYCQEDYIPVFTPLSPYPEETGIYSEMDLLEVSRYRSRYGDSLECGLRIMGNFYHPVFYEGDILLIGRNRIPHNGETGIFAHDGYLYIRKFFSHLNRILLEPLNGIGPDIILPNLRSWSILGYVLDVYRALPS